MDDFINVTKRDPQVQIKIKGVLDRFNRLLYNYQSKIGNNTLFQSVNLKEIMNSKGNIFVDIDIGIKMKISRIKYLESRLF